MPLLYVAADLKWDIETVTERFGKLLEKGYINYDFETEIVFIKNFLKYNSFENPNQIIGAIKSLELITLNKLDEVLLQSLKSQKNTMCKGKKDGFETSYMTLIQTLTQRVAETVPPTVTVAVTVTEAVTEAVEVAVTESKKSKPNNKSFGYYCRKINPAAPATIFESLNSYEEDGMSSEALIAIIDYCIAENKTAWSYVKSVINNNFNDGVRTLDDYKRVKAEFQNSRQNKSLGQNKKTREELFNEAQQYEGIL
jgi:DNA replication protein DnaD